MEQFKTQVLLLHSQQSTLDALSAGFNDRYSVHCATSGAEALTTLGETPIHVIVSAHELPGMSGLEALREAKKRSPDTIGILLAGSDKQDGLEALVGDQEVFQIVRGSVSPQALIELIESANKSVRMLALSESANDQKANVDEPVAEHIVMETSANGSTIISDGTGTMPALNPNNVNLAPGVGGREVDVLVLTKDEEFLNTVRDSARGLHNVYHAVTGKQADDITRKNKVGVLVTDAAVAGGTVEALTQSLRQVSPRLVAIVAGRRDDGELLMDLINRGHVYRFLLKPVSPGRARLAIEASVKHHMEAPDQAFKPKNRTGAVAAKPAATKARPTAAQPKPVARAVKPIAAPPPKPQPKLKPKPKPKSIPNPTAQRKPAAQPKRPPKATAKPAVRQIPRAAPKPAANVTPMAATSSNVRKSAATTSGTPQKIEPTISSNLIDSPLDGELDQAFGETNSFTETMTGIAMSVGRSMSSATGSVTDSAMNMLDSPDDASNGLKSPRTLAIGAGALAVVGIVGWLVFSGDPEAELGEATEVIQPVDPAVSTTPTRVSETQTQTSPAIEGILTRARAARDAGDLMTPSGNNAVELYIQTASVAGDDPVVNAEMQEVVSLVLGEAEKAILARNTASANRALDMAVLADPSNPRITFLSAQLNELQLREVADQARVAIRENRLEEASTLISQARLLAGNDTTEINLLTDELSAAKALDPTGGELAAAEADRQAELERQAEADRQAELERQAELTRQAEAERQAELTRQAEAERQAELARQAEAERQAELARQAEAERQAELTRQAEAERQAELARQAEAERQAELTRQAEAERQAEIAREAEIARVAELERQAEADRLEELNRQAVAERDVDSPRSAQDAAAAIVAAEQEASKAATVSPLGVGAKVNANQLPDTAEPESVADAVVDEVAKAPAAAAIAEKPVAIASRVSNNSGASTFSLPNPESASSPSASESTSGSQLPETAADSAPLQLATARQESTEAQPTPVAVVGPVEPELVPVSQLTRTNYVGPEYPRAARRRNITGSVDVNFTVTTDGRVRSLEVTRSEPGDTFDQAALDAVAQWRFQPVIENGVAVEKRSAVRMGFDLQ